MSPVRTIGSPPSTEGVVSLLRALLADAERGEIIGVAVVTELTGARIGTVHSVNDVHRALGGCERLRHRLLTDT